LSSPILVHHGIDIKFKRTKQIIDKTSFILKTSITNEQNKIDSLRFDLYVSTLVGNNFVDKISDLSSDSEQIMLVGCKGQIGKFFFFRNFSNLIFNSFIGLDFVKVRQANKSRPQLSNKDITLIQIYECDALEIHYNTENKSITENDLKNIFKSVWKNIFSYNFPSENCAEVEFINADGKILFKRFFLFKNFFLLFLSF
jgi:hypothetical protein